MEVINHGIHTVSLLDLIIAMLVMRSALKWLKTIFIRVFNMARKQRHNWRSS
jgi:hypothetical protein